MPGPYVFKQIFAADPSNTSNVAKGGEILLFAPGDSSQTPIPIWDLSRTVRLPNPVPVNDNGFGPAFLHDTLDQVAWAGGGFSDTFESYRGMKDDAEAAAAAASVAAGEAAGAVQEALAGAVGDADAAKVAAQSAAGLVGAPAGAAVLAAIGPGGAAEAALNAAYAPTAGGKPVGKGELFVNARDYGVKGNGTMDDRAALLAAANAAVTLGYPLVIPASFTCGLASALVLPAGLRLNTNGAKFKALTQTDRNAQIVIASNTTVTGGIYITTLGGINGTGLQIQGATNVTIDIVEVASTIAGQGSANVRDNALNINGSSYVTIGRVRVKNFDWPIGVENVPNLTINWLECETYVKAVWLRDTPRLRIHGGWIRGVSPNAQYLPGHNGILIEATAVTEDIRINNVTVYDAQEHGFRTSGPAQIKNLWLNNCAAINCTGTGFKILGSLLSEGVYNENVFLVNCLVEDSGLVNQNTCGFLIQMAKFVKVVSPIVRNRNKASSGYAGIRLGGVTHVQITDPDIVNPSQYGIFIDSELANVSDVKINGANIDQSTGWCVYLSNGQASGTANTFNNIEIEATCSLVSTAGGAFYAGRGAYAVDGVWTGFNRLTLRTHENIPTTVASGLVAAVTSSFFADIIGKKNGTTTFRNGSRWLDTTTGNVLLAKAGAWATL